MNALPITPCPIDGEIAEEEEEEEEKEGDGFGLLENLAPSSDFVDARDEDDEDDEDDPASGCVCGRVDHLGAFVIARSQERGWGSRRRGGA